MAKLILVTVGTSALDKKFRDTERWEDQEDLCKVLNEEDANNASDEYERQKKYLVQQLEAELKRFYTNGCQDFQSLTAELGSLMAMHQEKERIGEITNADRIVLLYSDTAEGKLCAEVNAEIVKTKLCPNTTCYHLEGLRAQPFEPKEDVATIFVGKGIKSFQRCIKQIVKDFREQHPEGKIFINITGGYKVFAPFSTIFAYNLSMNVVYLYERSNKIIWFPYGYLESMVENPERDVSKGIEVGIG